MSSDGPNFNDELWSFAQNKKILTQFQFKRYLALKKIAKYWAALFFGMAKFNKEIKLFEGFASKSA